LRFDDAFLLRVRAIFSAGRKNGVTFFTVTEEEGFQILWERKEDEPPLT